MFEWPVPYPSTRGVYGYNIGYFFENPVRLDAGIAEACLLLGTAAQVNWVAYMGLLFRGV